MDQKALGEEEKKEREREREKRKKGTPFSY